jgi:methylphosphotriester-DNA--protein-cysteine methyltransferase
MELDHEACYRALSTRDARFDGRFFIAVRTRSLLPTDLSGPDAEKRKR